MVKYNPVTVNGSSCMPRNATKILIDCDPGHDDAVAILYAARHVEVVGITTVFGNQTVEKTTRNAQQILALAGLDIPVAKGFARPLIGEAPLAPDTHGASGLDGVDLPEPAATPVDQHAAAFIIETARRLPGELVVAILGAHTNVAMALRLEPRLAEWVKGFTVMGGTAGIGNLAPQACVNILSDPEAAHIVFTSGVPMHWVGYETTRTVLMQEDDIDRLRGSGRRTAQAVADLADFYKGRQRAVFGVDGAPMHDACAIVPFVRPELIAYEDVAIEIEFASPLTRGMTVVDRRPIQPGVALQSVRPKKPSNARMAASVDVRGVIDDICAAVLGYA